MLVPVAPLPANVGPPGVEQRRLAPAVRLAPVELASALGAGRSFPWSPTGAVAPLVALPCCLFGCNNGEVMPINHRRVRFQKGYVAFVAPVGSPCRYLLLAAHWARGMLLSHLRHALGVPALKLFGRLTQVL